MYIVDGMEEKLRIMVNSISWTKDSAFSAFCDLAEHNIEELSMAEDYNDNRLKDMTAIAWAIDEICGYPFDIFNCSEFWDSEDVQYDVYAKSDNLAWGRKKCIEQLKIIMKDNRFYINQMKDEKYAKDNPFIKTISLIQWFLKNYGA